MDNSILFLLYFLGAGLGILAICGIGVLISIYCERRKRNNNQLNDNLLNYV
jgi:hypothetical protein